MSTNSNVFINKPSQNMKKVTALDSNNSFYFAAAADLTKPNQKRLKKINSPNKR
jgi:hypothetical protein